VPGRWLCGSLTGRIDGRGWLGDERAETPGFGGVDLVGQVERVLASDLAAGRGVLGVVDTADALGALPGGC
jgi:hypothetical protein